MKSCALEEETLGVQEPDDHLQHQSFTLVQEHDALTIPNIDTIILPNRPSLPSISYSCMHPSSPAAAAAAPKITPLSLKPSQPTFAKLLNAVALQLRAADPTKMKVR